jgi:hypothetical protein
MHALGFLHEHQRNDREDYLCVKFTRDQIADYQMKGHMLGPYDPESIMHYREVRENI